MLAEHDRDRESSSIPPHVSWESLCALAERAPFGIYIVDSEFRIALLNAEAEKRAFRNVQPAAGRDFAEAVRILWPEDVAAGVIAEFRRTLATGVPYRSHDYEHPRADSGEVEAYEWELHRITLPDGSYGVVCYYYDTTRLQKAQQALHNSEDRLAFLLKLSDALRPLTDPIAVQESACRLTGEHLGVDRAAYCEADATGEYMVVMRDWSRPGLSPAAGRFRRGDFGKLLTTPPIEGQAAVVYDAANDPRVQSAHLEAWTLIGVRAAIVYPLVREDRLVAGFLVHSAVPRRWTREDIALVGEIGERVWTAVERARAENALQRTAASFFSLIENAPFGIYIVDADFRIVQASQKVHQTFGIEPLIGAELAAVMRKIWPEPFASHNLDCHRRALETGEAYVSDGTAEERADRAVVEAYDWRIERIVMPDGRYGVVCYFYDQTRREQSATRLRASEGRQAFLLKFSDSLRTLPDADAISELAVKSLAEAVQADTCYLATMDVAADQAVVTHQFGFHDLQQTPYTVRMSDFPTPLQQSFDHTVVCNDAASDPTLTELDRQSFAGMHIGAFVGAILRHGDRNPIWILAVASRRPREWTSDEVALIEEVAERTWAAIERARAEQALRDADARKDEFLAMLAHELRNPLAAINNAGQILLRAGNDPKTLRSTAEILNRQVGHMVRQVDDLLDMSRISRGKIELRRECVNLAKVVNHAVESCRPLIESLRHELSIGLPQNPVFVLGDPVRLTQVVTNLLNNAAKFTSPGGRIWLVLEEENSEAVIRVRDNGIGIAGGEQDRIFELFVQLDKTLGRARDGLGIGLPLVRKLVELHGGSVAVHSEGSMRGTEFTVRLPALTSMLPQHADENPELPPLARRRVLVVDDNLDSADSLATLLTLMGHDVDTAHDGVGAVNKAVTFRPDLILLDIGMPRLNGYEAARWIREQGHKHLTIVALTGWGQEEDRRHSAEAGFDAHVVKPIDLATLNRLLADAGPHEEQPT